jgi:HKD family nuclease
LSSVNFITQGFTDGDDHFLKIKQLLSEKNLVEVTFNVAFIKTGGIDLILEEIKPLKNKITIFAGIRNGITSIQAIFKLIDLGCLVYLVDTGTGRVVFHPKVYIFEYNDCYKIIMGSANLTSGGLNGNIEYSSIVECGKDDIEAKKLIQEIKKFPEAYEKNIFKVNSKKEAFAFFRRGLLTDERIIQPLSNITKNRSGQLNDNISRIKLKNKRISKEKPNINYGRAKKLLKVTENFTAQWVLVWESNALTERDLNIPSGSGTNPTGSMLFKKGNSEGIDQRTYFRDNVFCDLEWVSDVNPAKAHLERATAKFQFEIRGINYGIYSLKITHNTNKFSRAYRQSNSMTQVHWGDAKEIIAHRELLGEKIKLYRNNNKLPVFRIEIG